MMSVAKNYLLLEEGKYNDKTPVCEDHQAKLFLLFCKEYFCYNIHMQKKNVMNYCISVL